MSIFRTPYPKDGYEPAWFTPTSRVNFCEEDYLVTPYIAEFVNTITNTSYVIYAYYGIRRLRGNPNAALLSLPYIGLAAVGILSAAFHATLTYAGQMSDDISMIFATAFVLHRAYSFGRPAAWTRGFGLALAAGFAVFAAYHCWTDELLVHFLLFAGMTLAVGRKTRALIRARVGAEGGKRRLSALARVGALCAVVGYALWNVDRHLCGRLIEVRRAVGQPWGYLLELHGWWHVLTAIGAYVFMALVEFLTTEEGERENAFAWPVDAYLGPTEQLKRK
ncbi:alkaline phytoceramidase [Neofusicoccum parvum]|nr:alkaline phytoceramidase [Neofusicoccum parvum]